MSTKTPSSRSKSFLPWLALSIVLLFAPIAGILPTIYRISHRDFVVRNAGPKPIHVLAVGTSSSRLEPLWSRASPEFQEAIAPGAQASFGYVFDGVNVCWLLVFSDGEAPRMLKTSLDGERCALVPPSRKWPCCWALERDEELVVPPTAELELAPDTLVAVSAER